MRPAAPRETWKQNGTEIVCIFGKVCIILMPYHAVKGLKINARIQEPFLDLRKSTLSLFSREEFKEHIHVLKNRH